MTITGVQFTISIIINYYYYWITFFKCLVLKFLLGVHLTHDTTFFWFSLYSSDQLFLVFSMSSFPSVHYTGVDTSQGETLNPLSRLTPLASWA